MKIAIHNRTGSFSDQWILYCDTNNIPYKLVDCYDSNILAQISDCDGLMWHWAQWDVKAILFARQLIYSIEKTGKKVFPNSQTCWHFDDKVGQKYLLEAIGAPLVPSYVFYDKESALQWVQKVNFPKVFKLRRGAEALNVRLIKTRAVARKIVRKDFRRGL